VKEKTLCTNNKRRKKMLKELMKEMLREEFSGETKKSHPYEIGKNYHVRTVTMAITGKLKAVYENELVFDNANWVVDTGRFNEYLKDTKKVVENEPMGTVIVGRGAIVDCVEIAEVYTQVK
jgi:hypothetical protein